MHIQDLWQGGSEINEWQSYEKFKSINKLILL